MLNWNHIAKHDWSANVGDSFVVSVYMSGSTNCGANYVLIDVRDEMKEHRGNVEGAEDEKCVLQHVEEALYIHFTELTSRCNLALREVYGEE